MQWDYDGFTIEPFEAGTGRWHARVRRSDGEKVIIDGVSFAVLEVGLAWSDPIAAIAGAAVQIDGFKLGRYATDAVARREQSAA